MASRLRRDPATVFDVVCEVAAPSDAGAPPFVLWRYPENYDEPAVTKAITEFAFPLGAETGSPAGSADVGESSAVQLFSFVLTDGGGRHTFGHCRHTPRSNTTLCLCTALPWPNVFYKLLNHVADVMNSVEKEGELVALLERAYLHGVPAAGETLHIDSALGRHKLEVIVPDDSRLPTMQDNRNLMEYWNAIGEVHMSTVFASMLRERRIVFTGPKLGQLSSCVLAAALLIRPMYWQHIFVPVLPTHLCSYLSAPMPYLIGVPSKTLSLVRRRDGVDLSDAVVVDVHGRQVHTPYDDYDALPSQVRAILRRQLERCNAVLGDGLARAFLRSVVALVGDYRSGLVRRESDSDVHFDTDKFAAAQHHTFRPYLNDMRHLQIFQEFVDERVSALNAGEPIDDEFEAEARVFDLKDFTRDMMREKGRDALSGLTGAVGKLAKDSSSALSALAAGATPGHHHGQRSSSASVNKWSKSPRSAKKQREHQRHTMADWSPPSSQQQPQHSFTRSENSAVASGGGGAAFLSERVKRRSRPQSSFYAVPQAAGGRDTDQAANCSPADDALELEGRMRRFGAVFAERDKQASPAPSQPAVASTAGATTASRVQSTPNLLAAGGGGASRPPSRCPSNLAWSSRATAASSVASLASVASADRDDGGGGNAPIDLIDLSLGSPDADDMDSFDPLAAKARRREIDVVGRPAQRPPAAGDGAAAPATVGRLTPPTLAVAGDLLSAFFDTATNFDAPNPVLSNVLPQSTLGTLVGGGGGPEEGHRHSAVDTDETNAAQKAKGSPKEHWVSFE